MSTEKSFSGGIFRRFKWLIWPLAAAVPLMGAFLFVICRTSAEALSPDEILAKKEWNDKELQNALARSMSPALTGQRKRDVMKHLSAQLKKRSPQERERIRIGAVVDSVTASLEQLRKMPETERNSMLSTMKKRAERSYNLIHSNPKKRKEFEEQLKTREMEAFSKEVNRVIFSELTPSERVKFAPVTRIWIKTMKSVGK